MIRAVILLAVFACGNDAADEAMFPADYALTYTEVRDCRRSGDHDLRFIRVLVDPVALEPYRGRSLAFPDGAIVVKEEYPLDDPTCSEMPLEWTVMRKRAGAGDQLGWDWQRVDSERSLVEQNQPSCFGCHDPCTGSGGASGYDHTCTDP